MAAKPDQPSRPPLKMMREKQEDIELRLVYSEVVSRFPIMPNNRCSLKPVNPPASTRRRAPGS